MADHIGSGGATWLVIGTVIVGALVVSNLPGHRGFASDGGDHQQVVAVMGSTHRSSDASVFKGAEMTALMGSSSLNLTHAQIAPGDEASVDIFAMMGSVTIRVPDGWAIDTRAVPVMGGIRDERRLAPGIEPRAEADGSLPRLVLHGFVMMGSIFIKS
jgi:hypothetical protein